MSDEPISITRKKPDTKKSPLQTDIVDFEEMIKQNKENEERVAKERAAHNKKVTKSHRLKK